MKGNALTAKVDEEKKWEAEDDMRTLMRAEEIKKDPKRLAAAKNMAKEKMDQMKSISSK